MALRFILGLILGILIASTLSCGTKGFASESYQPDTFITHEHLRKFPITGGNLYIYYSKAAPTVFHPPVMVFVPSVKDQPTLECRQ